MSDFLQNAEWIGCSAPDAPRDYSPIFRKAFFVEDKVASASLTLCGLGYHEAKINGQPVTDARFEPAFTDFDRRVYVSEYTVTALVLPGENILSVELGRGFYAMRVPNVWNHHRESWQDEPKLIASLSIALENGKTLTVVSDQSFVSRPGPITRCCLYTGQSFDGKIAESLFGFEYPGFDDSAWPHAIPMRAPKGELVPAKGLPTIKKRETAHPVSIKRIAPTIQLAEFSEMFVGCCRLTVKALPGQMIRLRYGERLENGRIFLEQDFVEGELQTDEILVGPSGFVDYEPKFSYYGFCMVEIIGDLPDLSTDALTAIQIAGDFDDRASFFCSEPLFNKIFESFRRTLRNNLHAIPTDTPVFEKNPWTGDAGVVAESACHLLELIPFFDKWMTDMTDSLREDGSISLIFPATKWGFSYSPEWTDCIYEIVWQLYRKGGKHYLEKYYPTLRKNMAYQLGRLDEDGLPDSVLGDWLAPGCENGLPPEGAFLSAPCYLFKGLTTLARMAELLARPEEAAFYLEKAEELRDNLNKKYFDKINSAYRAPCAEYRQTPDILALTFSLVPEEHREVMLARLVADIRARGDHLNTGMLGTKYLLPLLSENGHHTLACRIARQTTFPSWGYWYENGATTMWESWSKQARSRDHFLFGTVTDWLLSEIAGFRPGDDRLTTVTVAPRPAEGMTSCSFSIPTETDRTDRLTIDWQQSGSAFSLTLRVPAGCHVTLLLPDGGKIVEAASGIYRCFHTPPTL